MEVLRRPPWAVLVIAVLAIVLEGTAAAGAGPLTAAQVRAGLLYNFATFVEWPDEQAASQRPFVIGVLGADAVMDALHEIQGRPIKGRTLEVRHISRNVDVRQCHVLYVPASADNWRSVLADLQLAPVLTVGEHAKFTERGGVVRLYTEGSRLRFEINITRSKEANLQVSSKLLGLATVVREP